MDNCNQDKKILVVEDEFILFEELQEILENSGFYVCPYSPSYEEAMLNIQKESPDLVLLDIKLRGILNGIQLGEKLKNEYHIPFLYLTANAEMALVNEAALTFPDSLLVKTKPLLNKQQLLINIHLALNKQREPRKSSKNGIFVFNEFQISGQSSDKAEMTLLRYDQITYIETASTHSKKNHVIFHSNFNHRHEFNLRRSLNELSNLLPKEFLQISQSYIINLHHLRGKINGRNLTVNTNNQQPQILRIGRSFLPNVKNSLELEFQS